jgi:secreted trypsin-like serine protease
MNAARRATIVAATMIGLGLSAAPAQAVVGGGEVAAAPYPWLAAIGTPLFPLRPGGQFCAGALIAPDRVLTAGHCASIIQSAPMAVTVTFGRTDLTAGGGITVGVREVHIDPAFTSTMFGDDVAYHHDDAVLTLTAPVPLPTAPIGTPHGHSATILGWGITADGDWSNRTLRTATIPLHPNASCTTAYGAQFDPAESLCAGSPAADTAEFDSGGPLLVDGRVVGLTSWAKGTAEPGFPTVYTRVPPLGS